MKELEELSEICKKERDNATPCAWCDLEINKGEKKSKVSHGICERHRTEIILASEKSLGDIEKLASEWGYMV